MKTHQRNKLSTASIVGHLHTKTYLKSRNQNCYNVSFPRDILDLHNNDMYNKKNEELTDSD